MTYVARLGGASYYAYGSSRSGPWDEVRLPAFWNGPFSNPAAFIGRRGADFSLVKDGVEGPPFDEITTVVVSTAGNSLAYVGRKGGAYSVMWEGRRFDYPAKADSLGLAEFGGSLHLAWLLHEKDSQVLVVDGIRGRPYDEIGSVMTYDRIDLETLVLAPSGAVLAYGASAKEGWYMYRGGAREGPFTDLYSASLMPDGKTVIYFAVDSSDRAFAVVDGVKSGSFDNNGLFGELVGYNARGEWAVAGKRDGPAPTTTRNS
jgi:hypothetical protein